MLTTRPVRSQMRIRVLRPFYINREVQPRDAIIEVDVQLANELIGALKAEPASPHAVTATPLVTWEEVRRDGRGV